MISPVIQFNGKCGEAINLYEVVFGATDKYVEYYRDAPDDSGIPKTPETNELVMHAGMTICGTHINLCDCVEKITAGNMFKLNVFMDTNDEVKRAFHMLKENGKVIVELGAQFFSPMYGSVVDCYGVSWQLSSREGEV